VELTKRIFFELVDNGVVSYIAVVGAKSQKWGHFGSISSRPGVPLIDWWD